MGKAGLIAIAIGILSLWTGGFWATDLALAQSATWDATVVKAPTLLTAKSGSTVRFEVVLRNTGTTTWQSEGTNAVKLGTAKPRDGQGRFYHESWLSENRVATMQEEEVKPGQTGQFIFTAAISGAGGKVSDTLALVAEGITWFGPEIEFVVDVVPAVYKGELISVSQRKFELKTGETATVSVKVKNTGDTAWENVGATAAKIGTTSPYDRASALAASDWLSNNRATAVLERTEPGEEAEFKMSIQAPSRTGSWTESFGVVIEQIAWIPVTFTLDMTVVPAKWEGQWVQQSESLLTLSPGETGELWVEIRNTGNTVWTASGPNSVKLGTSRPMDRESVFYDTTWLSKNRSALVSPDKVGPGEVGKFAFAVTAPDKVGQYREYFQPVVENVTWLSDQGIFFEITVAEGTVIDKAIRVGITSTTEKITIEGKEGFVVRSGDDKTLVKKVSSGSLSVTATSGGYKLSTGEQTDDYLHIVPQGSSILTVKTAGISSSYNKFRGIIEIRRSRLSGNVWVVNILDIEDYMKGVAEVPDGWPREAQKAQMVAARTYAASKLRAPVADIFDLYDDTRDQVYYGYNYEIVRSNLSAAAEATRGLVIKYKGEPIKAFFFSDSGGYTANNEDIWNRGNSGTALPYLRAVRDPYAKPIEWTAILTQDYLKHRFDEALDISATSSDLIDNIEVTSTFVSGHAKTITFTMRSGKKIPVSMSTFDYLTDNNQIKSMLFSVLPTGSVTSPDFQFSGKGWGHGVGMPQWGARNMAEAGKDFKEILTYYYTGVQIEPL